MKTQLECFPCFLSQALNTILKMDFAVDFSRLPIFFLLKAKCPVVASDINVPLGSILLKKANI